MVTATQSAANNGGASTAAKPSTAKTQHDQFLKMLMTELTHQDPLQPMSGAEMTQQMLGIEQIQSTTDMEKQIQLMNQTNMLGAAQLIGKQVEVLDPEGSGKVFSGTVESVRLNESPPQVKLNGQFYPVNLLSSVTNP